MKAHSTYVYIYIAMDIMFIERSFEGKLTSKSKITPFHRQLIQLKEWFGILDVGQMPNHSFNWINCLWDGV